MDLFLAIDHPPSPCPNLLPNHRGDDRRQLVVMSQHPPQFNPRPPATLQLAQEGPIAAWYGVIVDQHRHFHRLHPTAPAGQPQPPCAVGLPIVWTSAGS